jgi:hypothetical protein
MKGHGERRLREAFDESRRRTRRTAPAFKATWDGARRRLEPDAPAPARRIPRLGALAAAALLLAAAAALVVTRIVPGPASTSGVDAEMLHDLADWTAPTDALLDGFGFGLPATLPTLGGDSSGLLEDLEALRHWDAAAGSGESAEPAEDSV